MGATWRIIPGSKWLITMVIIIPLTIVVTLQNGRTSWLIHRGVTNHLHPLEWSSKYMAIHHQLNPHLWPSSKHDTLENWDGQPTPRRNSRPNMSSGLMKTHWFPLIRTFFNPYFWGGGIRWGGLGWREPWIMLLSPHELRDFLIWHHWTQTEHGSNFRWFLEKKPEERIKTIPPRDNMLFSRGLDLNYLWWICGSFNGTPQNRPLVVWIFLP